MSDVLRQARLVNRTIFDPTNPEHVESFKTFLRTGNWGDVQFYPEIPFIEVPMTVMTKYCRHVLSVTAESAAERAERLAAKGVVPHQETPDVDESRSARLARSNQLMNESLSAMLKNSK